MIFFLMIVAQLCACACAGITHSQFQTIYQFPNGTWVENIAVRSNGNLLVTFVNTPELWETNPAAQPSKNRARLVHVFEDASMLNGITELTEDVFVVIASNTIWKVDFKKITNISRVAHVSGGVLNGMATLDAEIGTVLISDSRLGLVWLVNTTDGSYQIVLQDETMSARSGRRSLIGINGIKIIEDTVYYNNCPGELFCRVQIDRDTAFAASPYEIVAQNVLADDFALDNSGVAYLAGLDDNTVSRVFTNGTVEIIAGSLNSSELLGATAAAFGRRKCDQNVLYVTNGGGEAAPLNGTYVEGGKVVALRLGGLVPSK